MGIRQKALIGAPGRAEHGSENVGGTAVDNLCGNFGRHVEGEYIVVGGRRRGGVALNSPHEKLFGSKGQREPEGCAERRS